MTPTFTPKDDQFLTALRITRIDPRENLMELHAIEIERLGELPMLPNSRVGTRNLPSSP